MNLFLILYYLQKLSGQRPQKPPINECVRVH